MRKKKLRRLQPQIIEPLYDQPDRFDWDTTPLILIKVTKFYKTFTKIFCTLESYFVRFYDKFLITKILCQGLTEAINPLKDYSEQAAQKRAKKKEREEKRQKMLEQKELEKIQKEAEKRLADEKRAEEKKEAEMKATLEAAKTPGTPKTPKTPKNGGILKFMKKDVDKGLQRQKLFDDSEKALKRQKEQKKILEAKKAEQEKKALAEAEKKLKEGKSAEATKRFFLKF